MPVLKAWCQGKQALKINYLFVFIATRLYAFVRTLYGFDTAMHPRYFQHHPANYCRQQPNQLLANENHNLKDSESLVVLHDS